MSVGKEGKRDNSRTDKYIKEIASEVEWVTVWQVNSGYSALVQESAKTVGYRLEVSTVNSPIALHQFGIFTALYQNGKYVRYA